MKEDKAIIIKAIRKIMKGVIRLALRNGVSFIEFSDACKELYVDVAESEYGLEGRPTNMSRIALMTGISRHEVKRLKEQLHSLTEVNMTQRSYKISEVLSNWYEKPEYQGKDGKPLDIPLEGEVPSFNALVDSISVGGNIAAITILRELKRSQAVEDAPKGKLRVLRRHFIPNYDPNSDTPPTFVNAKKITFGCSMLVDHINTLFHNLYGQIGERTRFELRATGHSIKQSDIPDFYKFCNERSLQLLEQVDFWLKEHACDDSTQNSLHKTERMGLGIYLIQGEN